jgi:hypothetical protein
MWLNPRKWVAQANARGFRSATKTFCQVGHCKRKTSFACDLCKIYVCPRHKHNVDVAFDSLEIWHVREDLYYCMEYHKYLIGYLANLPERRSLPRSPLEVDVSNESFWPTSENFRRDILPNMRLIRGLKGSFCKRCATRCVEEINAQLEKNVFPVVTLLQQAGLICEVHEWCLLDVEKRQLFQCSVCGRHCCANHAAYCRKCRKSFCATDFRFINIVDPSVWGGTGYYIDGGCARKHYYGSISSYPFWPHSWCSIYDDHI